MKRKNSLIRAGSILVTILLLILLFRSCRDDPPARPDPDLLGILIELREELEAPGLDVETAAESLANPAAAVDFVRHGTLYVPYQGTFADPDAVLRTRVANSIDRARLLNALLREMGFESKMITDSWSMPKSPFPGTLKRDAPVALKQLADYLGYDLSQSEEDFDVFEARFRELAEALRKETDESVALLENRLPSLFESEPPKRVTEPESRWVWIRYRKPGEETWTTIDPSFDSAPPGAGGKEFEPVPTSTQVVVEGIRGDGSRLGLLTWSGMAVGRDLDLQFFPSDRNPRELFEVSEPNEIWAWTPVLQVGQELARGTAFTPEGALLADLAGKPAVESDSDGSINFYAPPVKDLKVREAICGDGKRVRVRLSVSTTEPPRWHAGHFSVTDNNQPVRGLRLETAMTRSRPVIIVIDTSGSMVNSSGRYLLAQEASKRLIDSLPLGQSYAVIDHGQGRVAVARELGIKGEEDNGPTIIDALAFSGEQRILDSIDTALSLTDEPSWVVFLTDGFDTESDDPDYASRKAATLAALRKSDSTVFPIGIGQADPSLLTEFAEASGSRYIPVDEEESLPDLYTKLGNLLSGSIEISYAIPGDPELGEKRNVAVSLKNFEGTAEGSYVVNEGTRFGIERIELIVRSHLLPEARRVIADFSDGYDGWRMMTRTSLWVSPSIYPQHIVESRRVDGWIETLRMAAFLKGGELDRSELNRSFSHAHASTVNALRFYQEAAAPDGRLPLGPVLWHSSNSFHLEGEDILRTTRIDWLRGHDWPDVENRKELARSLLGLVSAEGAVLGGQSVNARILAAGDKVRVIGPDAPLPEETPDSIDHLSSDPSRVMILPPDTADVGWRVIPSQGAVFGYTAEGYEIAKGASAEEVAAKYRELRSILQLYAYGGGSALAMAASPAGGVFAALCGFYDQVVALYCYSAVMMNQVAEGIESGEFDAAAAQRKAADLCDTSGDPDKFARDLMNASAWGFVRGTANAVTSGAVGPAVRQAAGANSATSAAAIRGATAAGVKGVGDLSFRRVGQPTAVSSDSLSTHVASAILGE